jgi:hypothetical protein
MKSRSEEKTRTPSIEGKSVAVLTPARAIRLVTLSRPGGLVDVMIVDKSMRYSSKEGKISMNEISDATNAEQEANFPAEPEQPDDEP